MWRTGSLTVAGIPALIFLITVPLFLFGADEDQEWTLLQIWYSWLSFYIIYPAGIIIYVTARLMLMVLAFLSLRSLPPDAYVDVSWTKYILHIFQ